MNATVSMCKECYRHIPAKKLFKKNGVYLSKECPIHGIQEELVEPDVVFYKSQLYEKRSPSSYWIDITNRCNLDCPHCYQMPDNDSTDLKLEEILNQIKSYPDDGFPLSLVGAEPTTRKDLDIIIKEIQKLSGKPRSIMIVTNGINLGKYDYAKKFKNIQNLKWTIGLNHPEYNGGLIRKKQEEGIENCIKLGLVIKNFTYTLGNLNQLDYVLHEIQDWNKRGVCNNARIQLGVEIGRTPNDHGEELYLSQLVKEAERLCKQNKWTFTYSEKESNRTHYAVYINGILHRLIKWCDVKTIDFEETQSESWAALVPHQPMSALLHQVILRDRFINEKKPLFDSIPKKYRNNDIPHKNIIYLSPLL
jgi:hypothetical protein